MEDPIVLAEQARHDTPEGAQAATALVGLGAAAVPAILDAVRDAPFAQVERLIAVLRRMKAPQVLDSLVQGLSAPEAEVALAVFETLGRWKDARPLRPLVDALGHPVHARMAIQALGRLGDPGAIEPLRKVASEQLAGVLEPETLEAHLTTLKEEGDWSPLELVLEAAVALARLGRQDLAHVPIRVATLGRDAEDCDEVTPLRIQASSALKSIVAPGAFDAAVAALEDPDAEVRNNALTATLLMGSVEAVPHWLARISSGDSEQAALAYSTLNDFTGEWPAGKELVETLEEGELEAWWRGVEARFSLDVCYRLGAPVSPHLLFPLLEQPSLALPVQEELEVLTGHVFGQGEAPDSWWTRESARFEPGRLYRYGFKYEPRAIF